MRDLLDAPEPQWQAERAKVETEGWGARLLSYEDDDGQWAGGAFCPHGFEMREWQRGRSAVDGYHIFVDPASGRWPRPRFVPGTAGRRAGGRQFAVWDEGGQPFGEGEVEECINGRVVADGAYFGVDVSPIVARLVSERLDDGGWNCERVNGSVRSSFATTVNVLEGLLEYERATGGTPESRVGPPVR